MTGALPTETTVMLYLHHNSEFEDLMTLSWQHLTIANNVRREWFLSRGLDQYGKPKAKA